MNEILKFWFPNDNFQKFWFDKSNDKIIIEKFSNLMKIEGTKNINLKSKNNEEILEYIILLDQFSRHIYRNDRNNVNFINYNNKALNYAHYFINERFNYDIKFNYLCFILMPLRHSNDINNYNIIIDILDKIKINDIYFNKYVNDKILFEKFKNATERNYKLMTN